MRRKKGIKFSISLFACAVGVVFGFLFISGKTDQLSNPTRVIVSKPKQQNPATPSKKYRLRTEVSSSEPEFEEPDASEEMGNPYERLREQLNSGELQSLVEDNGSRAERGEYYLEHVLHPETVTAEVTSLARNSPAVNPYQDLRENLEQWQELAAPKAERNRKYLEQVTQAKE